MLKYWVDTQFYDFDEDLIHSLQQFCTRLHDEGQTDMAKRLQEHISAKEAERTSRQESLISVPSTDLMVSGIPDSLLATNIRPVLVEHGNHLCYYSGNIGGGT